MWIDLASEVQLAAMSSSSCDGKINPPDCSDHDIALWLTVIAHALQAIHLGQVVDDPAVVSVHGREAVALLTILSLYWGKRWLTDKILKTIYLQRSFLPHQTSGSTKRWLSFRGPQHMVFSRLPSKPRGLGGWGLMHFLHLFCEPQQ